MDMIFRYLLISTMLLLLHLFLSAGVTFADEEGSSGSIEWEIEIGKGMTAPPAVLGERAFALGTDGWAVLINCRSGEILWRERAGRSFTSSPVAIDSVIYLTSQGGKRFLAAVSLTTGETLWKTDIGVLRAGPVKTEHGLILLEADGTLKCLNTSSPALLWSANMDKPCLDEIYVTDKKLLASCGDTIYSIGSKDGLIDRRFYVENLESFQPLTDGAGLLIIRRNGETELLETGTAEIIWSAVLDAAPGYHVTVSDNMAFLSSGSRLTCLGMEGGQTLWVVDLSSPVAGPPDLSGTLLAVTTVHGGLYIFDQSSGQQIDDHELRQPINTPPVFCKDRILISTQLGKLLSITMKTASEGGAQ